MKGRYNGSSMSIYSSVFPRVSREGRSSFLLCPKYSPKLNGCVERAHSTHATEEFYEMVEGSEEFQEHNCKLKEEDVYNTIRHHHALAYLTPEQFVVRWRGEKTGKN